MAHAEWIMVSDQLPANKVHVLVAYGRDGVTFGQTVAAYVRPYTIDCDLYDYDGDDADWDEILDRAYWPSGWYECQSANPEYSYCPMTEDVIAWCPLPKSPAGT